MSVPWLVVLWPMAPAVLWLPLWFALWVRATWVVRRALAGLTLYQAAFYRQGIQSCLDMAAGALVRSGLLQVSREGTLIVTAPAGDTAPTAPDAAAALLQALRTRSASQDGEVRLHPIIHDVPPSFLEAVREPAGFVPSRMWRDLRAGPRHTPHERQLLTVLLVFGGMGTSFGLTVVYLGSGPPHIGLATFLACLAACVAAPPAAFGLERRIARTGRLPKDVLARRCQGMLDEHRRAHYDRDLAAALTRSGHRPDGYRSAPSALDHGNPGGTGCGADGGGSASCGSGCGSGCGSDGGI